MGLRYVWEKVFLVVGIGLLSKVLGGRLVFYYWFFGCCFLRSFVFCNIGIILWCKFVVIYGLEVGKKVENGSIKLGVLGGGYFGMYEG